MHFVLDLETTGLPLRCKTTRKFFNYRWSSKYDTARVVSISWIVLNKHYQEQQQQYFVIRPKGFSIPPESTRIHNINDDFAKTSGVEFSQVHDDLMNAISNCNQIVSHNLDFDLNVLLSEVYRYDKNSPLITKLLSMNRYCTMIQGMKMTKRNKFPKLSELYKACFDKEITNAHHALFDTIHCCECFKMMASQNQNQNENEHPLEDTACSSVLATTTATATASGSTSRKRRRSSS